MRCFTTLGFLVLLAACQARINGAPRDPDAATGDDATPIDAPGWSKPTAILPAASPPVDRDDITLSSNALEMIFAIADGANGKNLYYTSRTSTADTWAMPTSLTFNDLIKSDETPRFSVEDKTLYFASNRVAGNGLDIYAVTRQAAGSTTTWGTPAALTAVNTAATEKWYMPCKNHYILVQGTATSGTDLLEGIIGGNAPMPITKLNSLQNETGTFLSPDCLTIYFASTRPTATSPSQLYKSTRLSLMDPWQDPMPVTDFQISGTDSQEDPWMSSDGHMFVFASNASGTKDLYISTR